MLKIKFTSIYFDELFLEKRKWFGFKIFLYFEKDLPKLSVCTLYGKHN